MSACWCICLFSQLCFTYSFIFTFWSFFFSSPLSLTLCISCFLPLFHWPHSSLLSLSFEVFHSYWHLSHHTALGTNKILTFHTSIGHDLNGPFFCRHPGHYHVHPPHPPPSPHHHHQQQHLNLHLCYLFHHCDNNLKCDIYFQSIVWSLSIHPTRYNRIDF